MTKDGQSKMKEGGAREMRDDESISRRIRYIFCLEGGRGVRDVISFVKLNTDEE